MKSRSARFAVLSLLLATLALPASVHAAGATQGSDHQIHDRFGDWTVRHVFDRHTLTHRYSDAKTLLVLDSGEAIEFQFNRSGGAELDVDFILKGWFDEVTLVVDGQRFTRRQGSLHTFFGPADEDLLLAVANAKAPIEVLLVSEGQRLRGQLSHRGTSAALRWIRALPTTSR